MPKQPIKILRVSEREEICNLVEDIYARSLEEHIDFIRTLEAELAKVTASHRTACEQLDRLMRENLELRERASLAEGRLEGIQELAIKTKDRQP